MELDCLGSNSEVVFISCVPLNKTLTTLCFNFFLLRNPYHTGSCEE